MAAVGQIQAHDAVVWLQKPGVDGEVGWRSRIRLDVDSPLLWVEFVGFQGAFLCKQLDLIDKLVPAIVAEKTEFKVNCMFSEIR